MAKRILKHHILKKWREYMIPECNSVGDQVYSHSYCQATSVRNVRHARLG